MDDAGFIQKDFQHGDALLKDMDPASKVAKSGWDIG